MLVPESRFQNKTWLCQWDSLPLSIAFGAPKGASCYTEGEHLRKDVDLPLLPPEGWPKSYHLTYHLKVDTCLQLWQKRYIASPCSREATKLYLKDIKVKELILQNILILNFDHFMSKIYINHIFKFEKFKGKSQWSMLFTFLTFDSNLLVLFTVKEKN